MIVFLLIVIILIMTGLLPYVLIAIFWIVGIGIALVLLTVVFAAITNAVDAATSAVDTADTLAATPMTGNELIDACFIGLTVFFPTAAIVWGVWCEITNKNTSTNWNDL